MMQLSIFLIVLVSMVVSSAQAQEKIRFPIGESSKTLSYGPLWIAKSQGFFEREGLDVPIVTMRGSPLTIQALTADSIHVANATVDTLIGAYEKGADIAMIGGLINGLGLSMIGGKKYKTYADLRGTTIGSQTLTSGTGFALRLVLKAHGLEYPRDYSLLNIGSAPDRYRALTSGQISATPVGVPLEVVAQKDGFNIIGYFADDVPHYQFNVYIIKKAWAEKNRPLVVRFMRAMVRAHRWLLDNREPACAYLSKEMKISVEDCRLAWEFNVKKKIWDRNADVNVEGIRTLIKIAGETNQIKPPLPGPERYLDQGYLKEALKTIALK